ncbi:MAG TPA: hypothetical protein VF797_06515 [Noviherbaspirillum sp.]
MANDTTYTTLLWPFAKLPCMTRPIPPRLLLAAAAAAAAADAAAARVFIKVMQIS